ncbi:MAG: Crp/Fnr family transcriptional regulator [Magnetococcales bacterium]|nr:Crp/Fnr family transcriptional regulator [Magnetococcales bacterium]
MIHQPSSPEREQLLSLWQQLPSQQQSCLLRYARFLVQEQGGQAQPEPVTVVTTPLPIKRPEQESVVQALKRLKRTYPMIDADTGLLNQASQLLMQKVLGTTADGAIIDQMEQLFQQRYQRWVQEYNQ